MACGTGYGSHIISRTGAAFVVGVDISEEAIAFAQKNYEGDQIEFHRIDLVEAPNLKREFDVVISFETIEHIQEPKYLIETAYRMLKPNGKFVCSTPNKGKYSDLGVNNPYHISELYYHEFKTLFMEYFEIEKEYHQTENINYQRIISLKQEVDLLRSYYNRSITSTILKVLKWLLRLKKGSNNLGENIYFPRQSDFDIEEMLKFENYYSVFILEGIRKQK